MRREEQAFGELEATGPEASFGDDRFRALLSERDWVALPPTIRRRFSRRLSDGKTVLYVGKVLESWTSTAGWWLAQAARLIGGPLPTSRENCGPSVVTVTE